MQRKVTFWAQATPGVTYYRCDLPARYLPGKVLILKETDVVSIGKDTFFPRQEGAAIWSFPGNTTRAILIAEMQDQGIPVLMELDDNYMVHPPVKELSQWYLTRAESGHGEYSYETCTDIARFCDGLIVSTPYLASVYKDINPNIHICPNSIDPKDWPSNPSHQPNGVLRVGWAASDSHMLDANIIREALYWASHQKNVEVVIMGIHPLISKFRFNYTHVPWYDKLHDYRQNLQKIDVMLCPLHDTEWDRCKSDVKAMEAAMSGACSVVGETEAYKPWFDQPVYVAKNIWDWKRILKFLVRNREEVAETSRLAKQYVIENRQIKDNVYLWEEAVEGAEAGLSGSRESLRAAPDEQEAAR